MVKYFHVATGMFLAVALQNVNSTQCSHFKPPEKGV